MKALLNITLSPQLDHVVKKQGRRDDLIAMLTGAILHDPELADIIEEAQMEAEIFLFDNRRNESFDLPGEQPGPSH